MSKRRYTRIQEFLSVIEQMLDAGTSHRQIEEELGLEGDRPVHNLPKRQRKKAVKGLPKFRGRKPAKTLQEYKYENKRLKMEALSLCLVHNSVQKRNCKQPVHLSCGMINFVR